MKIEIVTEKYFTLDDIRPKISGLYFLLKKGTVVYVGATTNLIARIAAHQYDKKFDSCRFIQCSMDVANEYEIRWIRRFQPKYNTIHVYTFMGSWKNGKRKKVRIQKQLV